MTPEQQKALFQVSTCFDSDPAVVNRCVLNAIVSIYPNTMAMINLHKEDRVYNWDAVNLHPVFKKAGSLPMKRTFCQHILNSGEAILIQDSRIQKEFWNLAAICLGLTRYLGVPIVSPDGQSIGTLCFMDRRSEMLLTQDDIEFLSLLAMRVSAEIERERSLNERLQNTRETAEALRVMNDLCRITMHQPAQEDLLLEMARCVRPLFESEMAAVFLLTSCGSEIEGVSHSERRGSQKLRFPLASFPDLANLLKEARQASDAESSPLIAPHEGPLSKMFSDAPLKLAPLRLEGSVFGLLVIGGPASPSLVPSVPHWIRPILDQLALMVKASLLQTDLHRALGDLRNAQQQMVEVEKLRTAGTLAASVAHDIRNILTPLQMELQVELDTRDDEVSASIRAQLNRFMTLTHRLLSFSRPRATITSPIEINELLERVLSMVALQAETSQIRVSLHLPPELPRVMADADQLEHLFVNLCLNAIQAMNESGGHLNLKAREWEDQMEITVTDTGSGIAPEHLESMFDPFFTTRKNGFGLGLFSCKRIVEEHGGQIRVASKLGHGTVVILQFPLYGRKTPFPEASREIQSASV